MTTLDDVLGVLPIEAIEVALLDGIAEQLGAPVPHEKLRDPLTGEFTEETRLRMVTGPLDLGWLAVTLAANLSAIAVGRLAMTEETRRKLFDKSAPIHADGNGPVTLCGIDRDEINGTYPIYSAPFAKDATCPACRAVLDA